MGPGKDCSFWLAGSCHFSEEYCKKGAHIKEKKGTRPYKAARSQQQDFGLAPTTPQDPAVVTTGAGIQAMNQEQKVQGILQLLASLQQQ